MHSIVEIFSSAYFWFTIGAWILAQLLKVPTYLLTEKKLDWKRFFGAGGMPSSHTASVMCLAVMIGMREGWTSAVFSVSLCLAIIVMYDAAGVRRETGKQSQVINEILSKILVDGQPISDAELKELVGHSPFEVAGGAVVGILMALCSLLVS